MDRAIDGHCALGLLRCQQGGPVASHRDSPLLIGGLDPPLGRCNPDLQQSAGLIPFVDFAVHQTGAGTHPLNFTGPQHLGVTHRVLMVDLTVHHHGDDFHVSVGMHAKPLPGSNGVVVDHQQGAEACPGGIEMIGERKGVAGIQPAQAAVKTVVGWSVNDGGFGKQIGH